MKGSLRRRRVATPRPVVDERGRGDVRRLLQHASDARAVGALQRACNACEKALSIDPHSVEALCAYASLAMAAGRPETTLIAASRAATLAPGNVDAHRWRGIAQRHCGQLENAIASFARVLELVPDDLAGLVEIATALLDAGDATGAEPFVNRVLGLDERMSAAQSTLGRLYAAQGRLDDAIAAYRRALASDSPTAETLNWLADALRDAGDLDGAIAASRQCLQLAPARPAFWSNLLLTLQCSDKVSASELADAHREFGRRFATVLRPLPASRPASVRGRRLKVGYVSASFSRHALMKFLESVLLHHDRGVVEVFCYHNRRSGDDVTNAVREQVDHFANVWGMRDGHLAAQIRRDGIDVLVDLDGHTLNNRLPVFLLRPATVQVTWLGYLSTTGVGTIDHRLTDRAADPEDIAAAQHTERLWYLPHAAWCYRPYDEAPDVTRLPLATNGYATFVCLNTPCKVTPTVLELWARILQRTERSRMLLHVGGSTSANNRLLEFFGARGIEPARIQLLGRQSVRDYLGTYGAADVALDTWPCAGGTTTCDALWMGLPVVSLVGDRSFSRTGSSLLGQVGVGDLAVASAQAYVSRACDLARDPGRLSELRGSLRTRMQSSPLLDGPAFARALESAFVKMCEQAHAGTRTSNS